MNRTLPASEARQQFSQVIQEAVRGGTTIIERHGEAIAVVVPIETFRQMERQRQGLFDQMRRIADQANLDGDEAMRVALDAQRATRSAERDE